jgi:hypothetical protein
MKITHSVALNFNPIFIPFIKLFGSILDFGFWIADLLYRFALSFFIKLTECLAKKSMIFTRPGSLTVGGFPKQSIQCSSNTMPFERTAQISS